MARKTKRQSRAQGQCQTSLRDEGPPFFRLPAELRNSIYELVARDVEEISVRGERVLYCPDLSLVNRQIRQEYEQIYIEEAPKRAGIVKVHITNFVHPEEARIFLYNLPPYAVRDDIVEFKPDFSDGRMKLVEAPLDERAFNLVITVTNTWEPAALAAFMDETPVLCPRSLSSFVLRSASVHNRSRTYIYFDRETFDTTRCRILLPSETFLPPKRWHGSYWYRLPLATGLPGEPRSHNWRCYHTLKAFNQAFHRYTPKILGLEPKAEERLLEKAIVQRNKEKAAQGKVSRHRRSLVREKRRAERELEGTPQKASRLT